MALRKYIPIPIITRIAACAIFVVGCSAEKALPTEEASTNLPPAKTSLESPEDQLLHAGELASQEQFREAAAIYESVRAQSPAAFTSLDGIKLAQIYAHLGDAQSHESLCRWLFEHLPANADPIDAERTGKAYVLYPHANDAALLSEASARIDYGVKNVKGGLKKWCVLSQGLARYRQEDYPKAIQSLANLSESDNEIVRYLSLTYLALAKFAKGDTAGASDAHATVRETDWTFLGPDGAIDTLQWHERVAIAMAAKEVDEVEIADTENWTAIVSDSLHDWSDPGEWWNIQDGTIVAESEGGEGKPDLHYLVWNQPVEGDFEVRLEYRIISDEPQDAGLNFNVEGPAGDSGNLPGYQVELVSGRRFDKGWGHLFGNIHDGKRTHMFQSGKRNEVSNNGEITETDLPTPFNKKAAYRAAPEWNACRLTVAGDHIQLHLNGHLANELIDHDPNMKSNGTTIALQFRPANAYRFEVKNLKWRKLE